MGTFTANMTLFHNTVDNIPISGQTYYGIDSFGTVPRSGSIGFTLSGVAISLDGGAAIAYQSLPSGFRPTSLTFIGAHNNFVALGFNLGYLAPPNNPATATSAVTRFAAYGSATNNAAQGGGIKTFNYFPNTTTPPLSATTLLGLLEVDVAVYEAFAAAIINLPKMSGNYVIDVYTWTIDDLGTQFRINSDGISPDLSTITDITIQYYTGTIPTTITVPSAQFVSKTSTAIVFNKPKFCSFTGATLFSANGSTIPSGSIIGSVTI